MKKEKLTAAVLILLAIIFIVNFILIKNKEKASLAVIQNIPKAFITLKAPPFKEELVEKGNALEMYLFTSSHKKADYSLTYAVYEKSPDIKSAAGEIAEIFKLNDFKYKEEEIEIGGNPAVKIDGTYVKDGKNFALKELLIKKDKRLWQLLTLYLSSPENETAAQEFINSAVLDDNAGEGEKKNVKL
ncbi:MAG: hypothetical protein LBQ47_09140 [Endomicrobium sp.]|jgi:hypothetical protein|nr:hypothetical protein [Endomicrobium sp.]